MRLRELLNEAVKPTIEQIVAKHAAKVKDPFNKCAPVSRALADDLVKHGYPARVIRCSYLLPYARDAHQKWQNLGSQMYWVHYVVRVGNSVFDLTRRQFFPESPQPFVQSWADFKNDWEEIGIDWEWHRKQGLVKDWDDTSDSLKEAHHAYDNPGFDTQFQPLKAGDTLRVFHGFRDSHDAMLAATRGLSGASRAKRVYSYEADNNPKGLFVTISLKVADEFAGAYGVQCIMEFNVNESDLEAPVWPGGSYTVQGGYSQYFGHGAKGRAGRHAARRDAEARMNSGDHYHDAVKQSDRKHLADMLFSSREAQALFIGHLNPAQIVAFHVRPSGSGGNVPWERISREEFIQRYQNEITIPKEETWKERVFEPNEPFNGEKFMAALKARYKDHAESGLRAMWFGVITAPKQKALHFAEKFDSFLWPRQMPEAIRWFAKTYGTKPGADD